MCYGSFFLRLRRNWTRDNWFYRWGVNLGVRIDHLVARGCNALSAMRGDGRGSTKCLMNGMVNISCCNGINLNNIIDFIGKRERMRLVVNAISFVHNKWIHLSCLSYYCFCCGNINCKKWGLRIMVLMLWELFVCVCVRIMVLLNWLVTTIFSRNWGLRIIVPLIFKRIYK